MEYILAQSQDYDDGHKDDKSVQPTGKAERDGFFVYVLNTGTALLPVAFPVLGILAFIYIRTVPTSDDARGIRGQH